ncbi:ABC transporter substrate-binding protein [Streptomyces fumanus]|uniref:Sugar ABC transporter substrate-binding protein n=1 Tax=Streptomyces fumanus TaxID=67302 RepID=A0A919ADP0_9ACTN|nr:extracellular solute-binding protein [Streptomyces fumanus]GHE97016.1 sugar ABC transporter substrate-binding protein [Streptomyces fumanus]
MGKRMLSVAVLATTAMTVAGCGGGGTPDAGETAAAPLNPASVKGDITVLTNRTDLVNDGTMKKYAAEFNKVYPKVEVKFEGMTDYEGEVRIRMNTDDYGDVLLIPGAVAKGDYPKFFTPLGSASSMRAKYLFTDRTNVDDKVYGIASFGTANGLVYNKALWKKAGITDWPASPREFLADLKAIADRTDATPYYTNFKDGWPLSDQWTNGVGSVSCDSRASDKLAETDEPWSKGSDLQVIDGLLYDIVHGKLSEKDPATTNWEQSKTLLAKGEIGSMMLGSWSISQMRAAAQKAGENPDDIGFMPFPARSGGQFCSTLVSDYQQAVNIHSDHKAAARAWIDWFTEKSGYAATQGAVSALKADPMPKTLEEYVDNDVKMVERSEKRTAEVNAIDKAAEIGLNQKDYRQKLVDIARGAQSGSLEDYFDELNRRWSEARQNAGS